LPDMTTMTSFLGADLTLTDIARMMRRIAPILEESSYIWGSSASWATPGASPRFNLLDGEYFSLPIRLSQGIWVIQNWPNGDGGMNDQVEKDRNYTDSQRASRFLPTQMGSMVACVNGRMGDRRLQGSVNEVSGHELRGFLTKTYPLSEGELSGQFYRTVINGSTLPDSEKRWCAQASLEGLMESFTRSIPFNLFASGLADKYLEKTTPPWSLAYRRMVEGADLESLGVLEEIYYTFDNSSFIASTRPEILSMAIYLAGKNGKNSVPIYKLRDDQWVLATLHEDTENTVRILRNADETAVGEVEQVTQLNCRPPLTDDYGRPWLGHRIAYQLDGEKNSFYLDERKL